MKPAAESQTNEPDTRSRQAKRSKGQDLYDAYIEAFARPSVHRPVDPEEEIPFDVKDRLWQH